MERYASKPALSELPVDTTDADVPVPAPLPPPPATAGLRARLWNWGAGKVGELVGGTIKSYATDPAVQANLGKLAVQQLAPKTSQDKLDGIKDLKSALTELQQVGTGIALDFAVEHAREWLKKNYPTLPADRLDHIAKNFHIQGPRWVFSELQAAGVFAEVLKPQVDEILKYQSQQGIQLLKAQFPQVPASDFDAIANQIPEKGIQWAVVELGKAAWKTIVAVETQKGIAYLKEQFPAVPAAQFDAIATEIPAKGLQWACAELARVGWKIALEEEQLKKITDLFWEKLSEGYLKITSHEMELRLSQVVSKYYYDKMKGEALKARTSEEDLDANIGPIGKKTGDLLSRYVTHFLDQYLIEDVVTDPDKHRIVIDLGRDDAGRGLEPAPKPQFSIPPEAIYEPGKDGCSYIPAPILDKVGVGLWFRRDRAKLEDEVRQALKVGLCNVKNTLRQRFTEDPDFNKNLMAEIFQILDEHMQLYSGYVRWEKGQRFDPKDADLNRVANGFGNKLHYALQGSTDEDHLKQQKQHSEALSKVLKPMLFPGDVQDLPVSAQYRDVLSKLVLPAVGAEVINTCMLSLSNKRVINKLLLKILNELPKPEEIEKGSQGPEVDEILKEAAGRFLVNILTIGEPEVGKLLDSTLDGLSKLLGSAQKNLFRERIEAKMGELLGAVVTQWLNRFDTPEKLLDGLLELFLDGFLIPELEGDKGEHISDEEVIAKLSEVRQNLGPYVIKSFKLAILSVRDDISGGIDRLLPFVKGAKHYLGKWYDKVTTTVSDVVKLIWNWLKHFLHWDVIEKKEAQHHADTQARIFLQRLHHPAHQNMVRNLFDVALARLSGQDIPIPAARLKFLKHQEVSE